MRPEGKGKAARERERDDAAARARERDDEAARARERDDATETARETVGETREAAISETVGEGEAAADKRWERGRQCAVTAERRDKGGREGGVVL
ncbi:hypothetical protein ACLOJK_001777 [Asimina triloba]